MTKDIKHFADLPPHVQQNTDRLSDSPFEHQRNTVIAIEYLRMLTEKAPHVHRVGMIPIESATASNKPLTRPRMDICRH